MEMKQQKLLNLVVIETEAQRNFSRGIEGLYAFLTLRDFVCICQSSCEREAIDAMYHKMHV